MDVLTTVTTIFAALQTSQAVIQWLNSYITHAVKAASEARVLCLEITSLHNVLTDIDTNHRHILLTVEPILQQCRKDLDSVVKTLETGQAFRKFWKSAAWPFKREDIQEHVDTFGRYVAVFTLALTSNGLDLIKDGSSATKNTQDLLLQLVPRLNSTYENVLRLRAEEAAQRAKLERDDILRWLFTTSYMSKFVETSEKRAKGTGKWIKWDGRYVDWLHGNTSRVQRLWLSGIAGAGKSVLTTGIIENINSAFRKPKIGTEHHSNVGIAFFYFDFRDTKKQNVQHMALAIIRQLLTQLHHLPECVLQLKRSTAANDLPEFNDAISCISELARSFRSTYFVLDGLDEASPQDRTLDRFVTLCESLTLSSRILVTSRKEYVIENILTQAGFQRLSLLQSQVDRDIRLYVEESLTGEFKTRYLRLRKQTRDQILFVLTKNSNGIFLWTHGLLKEIFKQRTEDDIKTALAGLPKDVNEMYRRILEQWDRPNAPPRDKILAKRALTWLSVNLSPMSLEMLCEAVTIDLNTFEIDEGCSLLEPTMLLEICGSLIVKQPDHTLGLAHLSVKHFLASEEAGNFQVTELEAHRQVFRASWAYMMSDLNIALLDAHPRKTSSLDALLQSSSEIKNGTRAYFTLYCSQGIFKHLYESHKSLLTEMPKLNHLHELYSAQEKLNRSFDFIHACIEEDKNWALPARVDELLTRQIVLGQALDHAEYNRSGFTPKYGSIELTQGSSLAARLVANRCTNVLIGSVDTCLTFGDRDKNGWCALDFAAALNDKDTVEWILNQQSQKDENILYLLGSALICAAGAHAELTSQLLISRLLLLDTTTLACDNNLLFALVLILSGLIGNTALYERMSLVLARTLGKANSMFKEACQLALFFAASESHVAFVRLWLQRAPQGIEEILSHKFVKLWKAPADRLYWTANQLWNGYLENVCPSEEEITSYYTGGAIQRAIRAAAAHQDAETVQLLATSAAEILESIPDWRPTRKDFYRYQDEKEKKDDFDPFEAALATQLMYIDQRESNMASYFQAALWCAAKEERTPLLEILLRMGLDPNMSNGASSWTPLFVAAQNSNLLAMQVLLSYSAQVDRHVEGMADAPLIEVLKRGVSSTFCLEATDLLLAHGANPNILDRGTGRTPLLILCEQKYSENLEYLFAALLRAGADTGYAEHNEIKLNQRSRDRSLLVELCDLPGLSIHENAHPEILKALLDYGMDPNREVKRNSCGTPLIAACASSVSQYVDILLRYGADPNRISNQGKYATALSAASAAGSTLIVESLLHQGANPCIDTLPGKVFEEPVGLYGQVEIVTQYGSPVLAAIEHGTLEVLQTLVNANKDLAKLFTPSSEHGTPLVAAAFHGHSKITKLLLDYGAVPTHDFQDRLGPSGYAPLTAAMQQHTEVLQLLASFVNMEAVERYADFWIEALINNIAKKNYENASMIMDFGVEINQQCESEEKHALPIMAAAWSGDLDFFKVLESRGAKSEIHGVGKYGNCLIAACASGSNSLVSYLLNKGHDPKALEPHRTYWSPFIAAGRKGDKTMLQTLIDHGGFNTLDVTGTSWHHAFETKMLWDNQSIACRFHEASKIINMGEDFYGHPLIDALDNHGVDAVKLMLKRGIDVNLTVDYGKVRLPIIAAASKNPHLYEFFEMLVEKGAILDRHCVGDIYGSTSIAACQCESLSVLKLLRENHSADPLQSVPNCSIGNMLISAVLQVTRIGGRFELVLALLAEGCDPLETIYGSLYGNAFIAAVHTLQMDCIELFMEKGADINYRTEEGIYGYPLIAALARQSLINLKFKHNIREEERKFEFVKILLELGADPNVKFHGRTPLVTAMEMVRNYDDEIVSALLKHGADPNEHISRYLGTEEPTEEQKLKEPYSALTAAALREKHSVVRIMLKHGADRKFLPPDYVLLEDSDDEDENEDGAGEEAGASGKETSLPLRPV